MLLKREHVVSLYMLFSADLALHLIIILLAFPSGMTLILFKMGVGQKSPPLPVFSL